MALDACLTPPRAENLATGSLEMEPDGLVPPQLLEDGHLGVQEPSAKAPLQDACTQLVSTKIRKDGKTKDTR